MPANAADRFLPVIYTSAWCVDNRTVQQGFHFSSKIIFSLNKIYGCFVGISFVSTKQKSREISFRITSRNRNFVTNHCEIKSKRNFASAKQKRAKRNSVSNHLAKQKKNRNFIVNLSETITYSYRQIVDLVLLYFAERNSARNPWRQHSLGFPKPTVHLHEMTR